MPVRLAGPRNDPAVEETEQFLSIIAICLQAGIRCCKIILFQRIRLLFEGFGCEDEVIRNYGKLVEDKEMGRKQIRDKEATGWVLEWVNWLRS